MFLENVFVFTLHVRLGEVLEWEDGLVDGCGVLGTGEDAAASRSAQRLVGGEGDHIGERHGIGMHVGGSEDG